MTADTATQPAEHHVALIKPDSSGRFSVKRWIDRNSDLHWRVFPSDGGRTLRLEAVELPK